MKERGYTVSLSVSVSSLAGMPPVCWPPPLGGELACAFMCRVSSAEPRDFDRTPFLLSCLFLKYSVQAGFFFFFFLMGWSLCLLVHIGGWHKGGKL